MPAAQLVLAALNGQLGLLSSRQFLAGSGKTFSVTNPTVGTAIAYANKTAWSATANGLLAVQNNNAVGGPNIYFDRLSLIQTATAPTASFARFEVYNETGLVTLTTAVATVVPVQINTATGGAGQGTGAIVQAFNAGAATVPAAVGVRRLQALGQLAIGTPVVQDEYVIDFGSDGPGPSNAGAGTAARTLPARVVAQTLPVVVPPQTTSWINLWGPATNVPSFEFEFVYIEV
jgi:hypothetical protein